MGLGGKSDVDMMESSIVSKPHSIAVRFRNRIYKHIIRNRDILGYPKGCKDIPYMFVSNDLRGIFIEFMGMLDKHRKKIEIQEKDQYLIGILELLILSFETLHVRTSVAHFGIPYTKTCLYRCVRR